MTDTDKLTPSAYAVLEALREAGAAGLTPLDVWREAGAYRFSARLRELRQAGYVVRKEHVRDRIYRYVLEPEQVAA